MADSPNNGSAVNLNSGASGSTSGNTAAMTSADAAIAAGNDAQLASTQLGAANKDQTAALSTLQSIQSVISQMLPPQLIQYAQPLAQLAYTGEYNYQDVVAAIQQQSQLNGIQLDPAAMAAQETALNQYQAIAEGSGFTPIERAGIAQTMNQIQTQNTGANASVVNQNQQQGQGGVVNSLAARLISQQGANQNASLSGANIAGAGQTRAISALGGEQTTGQSIAGQEVGQQNIEGEAQNAINQYNTQLKQTSAQANQTAANTAASQEQNINTNLEQANVQNQLAGQSQEIGAAATTAGLGYTQTGQLEQNAAAQAGVNTSFGLPEEASGINAQNAETAAQTTSEAAGVNSLYNSLSGSGTNSGTAGTTNLASNPNTGSMVSSAADDGFSTGGEIKGPGTPTSDSIPAKLSTGEFVVKAKAVDQYEPVVKAINDMKDPEEIKSILDKIAPMKQRKRTPFQQLAGEAA